MSQSPAFPGNELRARRVELGLGIDDVYRRIRVPIQFIQDIEVGDLESLPAPCYSVGFLRTYCQFLELDANRYVDTYQACIRPQTRFLRRTTPVKKKSEPPRWIADAISWAAVCGIIALGWFAYTVIIQPNSDPGDGQVRAATQDDFRLPSPSISEER